MSVVISEFMPNFNKKKYLSLNLWVFHVATSEKAVVHRWERFHYHLHTLGEGFTKKDAVLLDFVQMRGGRALPQFFVTFS